MEIMKNCGVLYLFILFTIMAISNAISYDQLQWKLASSSKPNHYDTCRNFSLLPYIPTINDFIWNSTVLQYVVETALGENILPASYKGLTGCCSSSLWCIAGKGCFTQNFGGSFVNFGWMRNNSQNIPVYSCISSSTNLGNIDLDLAFVDGIQTNTPVLAIGNGATENSASFLSQIDGYYCPYGNICQTFRCSSDYNCPLGMGCFNVSGYPINSCHQFCANANDTSCPCGQSCVPSEGSASTAMYVCASADLQGNMPTTNTLATCAPLGGLLLELPVGQSASFSFASDLQGAEATATSLAVLSCTKDSACIDYNPCTRDTCQLGKCYHEPIDAQCLTNSPTILEQTAPYTYLTSVTSSADTATTFVPSFASLYASLGFAARTTYTNDRVVIMGFTWNYFGNILTNFMVDVFGVLSFAPYIGCDDADQCLYFTSTTNSISVGYNTDRETSSSYKAYAVHWSDENNDGKGDAVHVLFLAPSTPSVAEVKPSTIVSIFQDGSVRMTYNTTVAINSDPSLTLMNQVSGGSVTNMSMLPFTGLWGARAGRNYLYPGNASDPSLSSSQYAYTSSSTSRYHIANVSFVLASASDSSASSASHVQAVAFCPFAVSVCAPTSCVSRGEELRLRWNGTNSCFASMDRSITQGNLSLSCSWLGGLYITAATYDSVIVDGYRAVTCTVPTIDTTLLMGYNNNKTDLASGVLLSVNIIPSVSGATRAMDDAVGADGDKAVRAMYYDSSSGELAHSNLLVRYYPSSGDVPSVCGCRPFISTTSSSTLDDDSLTCATDSNICGGNALYGDSFTSSSTSRRRMDAVKQPSFMEVTETSYYDIIQPEDDILLFATQQQQRPANFAKKVNKKSTVKILSEHDDIHALSSSSSSSSFLPLASIIAHLQNMLSPSFSLRKDSLPASVDPDVTGFSLAATSAISSTAVSSAASSVAFGAKKYVFDCANIAFGSAYVDACGVCSGGVTRRTPISPVGAANGLCLDPGSSGSGDSGTLTIITQTIILLMVICCLTFLTSAVTFSIRRMLLRRQTEQFLVENELALQQMMMNADLTGRTPSGRMRALTDFEREALGEVVYSQAFAQSLVKSLPSSTTTTDNSNNNNNNNNNNSHASLNSIPSATSVTQSQANNYNNTTLECPICLVEFVDGDILRHLPEPCGHVFHRDCVDHWFHQSSQCPLCKRSMRAILAGTYDEHEHHRQQHMSDSSRSRPVSSTSMVSTSANNNNHSPFPLSSNGFLVVQGHDVEDIDVTVPASTSRPTSRTHRHHHHHHHNQSIDTNNNMSNYANYSNNVNYPGYYAQSPTSSSSYYDQQQPQYSMPNYPPPAQDNNTALYDANTRDYQNDNDANGSNNVGASSGRAILTPEERLRVEAMRLEQRRQEELFRYYAQNNTNNNSNSNYNNSNSASNSPSRRYDV